jgi:ADP-ribose pyrophosphatase
MTSTREIVSGDTQYIFPESACAIYTGDNSTNGLLLIEQWRPVHNKITLELPGGKLGPGETPEAAAIRELFEETGVSTDKAKLLVSLDLDLSISWHRTHLVRASATFPHGSKILRADAKMYRISQAWDLVDSGMITHAPTVAAVLLILAGKIDA